METQSRLWNRSFIAICLSSFFLFMTFYILAVTLPIFVLDELKSSQEQIGLVMTVFVIATVIMRPLTGKWVDQYNRKKLLFISLLIFLVATCLYLGTKSIILLLALRFLHGIGFGMGTTASGAIAVDLIPDHRKGEGIGYFSLFMSLAMVIGPFVGLTVVSQSSFTVLFAICITFSFLSFLFGSLADIPKTHREASVKMERVSGWKSLVEPKSIPIAIAGSVLAFSYGGITTFISVYAKELGFTDMSSYFFIVFAAMIVLSRPFTGKVFDTRGPNILVYPGIFLFVVGMFGLSQAHTPYVFLATGALIGLGFGALLPSFQTIAVQAAPGNRRGLATSTYFLLFDTGYGLGSYILGIIASHTNYHTMYMVSSLIVAFTAVLYYLLHHRNLTLSVRTKVQHS